MILYNSASTALVYLQLSTEPPLTLSHAAKQSFGSQKVSNRTGMPRSNSVKAREKLMATWGLYIEKGLPNRYRKRT